MISIEHFEHFNFFDNVQGSDKNLSSEIVRGIFLKHSFEPTIEALKSRDFSKIETHECPGKCDAVEYLRAIINPGTRKRNGFCIGLVGSNLTGHLRQFAEAGFSSEKVIVAEFNLGCYEYLKQQALSLPEKDRPIIVYGDLIRVLQLCKDHRVPVCLLDADGVDTFPSLEDRVYPILNQYPIPYCTITGVARGALRKGSPTVKRVMDTIENANPPGAQDAIDLWPSKGVGPNQSYGNHDGGHKVSASIKPYARAMLPQYDICGGKSYEGAGGWSNNPAPENNNAGHTPGRSRKGAPMYSIVLRHSRVQEDKTDGGLSVGGNAYKKNLQKER